MKRLYLCFALFFVAQLLLAKVPSYYDNKDFIKAIYNVDDLAYQSIKCVGMDAETRVFFDAYHLFWTSIARDDQTKMLQAQTLLKHIDLVTIEEPILRVSLALLKMRIALINKSYLSAIHTQTIIRRYFATPEIAHAPYDRFLRGMYHYFVSYGREKSLFYRVYLAGWPDADSDKGFAYLQEMALSSSCMIAAEASYFLGRIFLEYEDQAQCAQPLFMALHEKYPNNPIYTDFERKCR